jgi:MFS family permease
MMGTLMVVPLLPFYATRMGANGFTYTVLVSAFSLATLLSSPLWGRFSDRYGRRPALLIALGASAISYVIFAFANSLPLLLLSRIVQGAGGGTVGVVQAYVADSTEPKNRARALGWLSAATNVGVAVGPLLGSGALWLGLHHTEIAGHDFTLGQSAPGLLAAVICLSNMYFAWRYLRESHVVTQTGRHRIELPGRSRAVIWSVIRHSDLPSSRLIWIYSIGLGAFMAVMSIFALLLAKQFGVTAKTIGYFFAYVGVMNIIARAILLGPALDRFGEPRLSRIGTVLLALGLVLVPLSSSIPVLALSVALLPLGTAFTFPCVTAMLSRVISPSERGLFMGVQQTFGGITRVVFPLGAGLLYDRFAPGVPFWTAGALVAGTLLLGLNTESYLRPESAPAATPPTDIPSAAAPASPPTATVSLDAAGSQAAQ